MQDPRGGKEAFMHFNLLFVLGVRLFLIFFWCLVVFVLNSIISRLCVENAQCRTLLLNLDNSISALTAHTSISGF